MCDNCFTIEIKKFKDLEHWTAFDLELSQKLAEGKLKQIRVVSRWRQDEEEILYVYQCATCGQKWKLEEPERSDGHFLRLSTFESLFTREVRDRQIGLIVLVGIVVLIVIKTIFW